MSLLPKYDIQDAKSFFKIDRSERLMRLLPIVLFVFLIVLDQVTKALVVKYIAMSTPYKSGETISVIGEWIQLVHVRNQGVAWSLLGDLTGFPRVLTLIIVPIIFLSAFGIWSLFTDELNKVQRWASASIMAGGLGNIIDRIFRYASGPKDHANGVVDFMDMSFPVTFLTPSGRWPTFNVADASIVLGVSVLIVSMIIIEIQMYKKKKKGK